MKPYLVLIQINIRIALSCFVLGFIITFFLPTSILAQETNNVLLKEVVISNSREAEPLGEVPFTINRVDRREIEFIKPTRLEHILNRQPGVYMSSLGNEQHTLSIRRPFDFSAYYSFLEDGISIRPVGLFQHNSLLEMNMANASSIEIIKGPSSALYGSESIGGGVNMVSYNPSDSLNGNGSILRNSIGYSRFDGRLASTIKNLGVNLAGYYA